MPKKKRVALIGASARGIYAFADPLVKEYAATHELVGAFDIKPRRIKVMNDYIGLEVPAFADLDEMMEKAKPDTVVITTIDATHVDYLEKAFANGVDSVVEKPLCTTADHCQRIRQVQADHPGVRSCTAHNYRYAPHTMKIKEVVQSGQLGEIRSVVFHEHLDQRHGTSYFRRWNRAKKNSGGLLIHKACHCFDLINWFVDSRPKTVLARGSLSVYGPDASPFRGERCSTCPHTKECRYYVDLAKDNFRSKLYFESREPGDYTPDLCVFDPEIDAEDQATVAYEYENGVTVTFDLCAYTTYEGVLAIIEGSEGRLEYISSHSTAPMETTAKYGSEITTGSTLRLYRFDRPYEDIAVEKREGGHGGADPLMLEDLFTAKTPSPILASLDDGIQAVLIGAAANISIAENRPVDVQGLLG